MKLTLVIVSYNSYSDIIGLLDSLKQQKRQADQIIIVDNCSPNWDWERLEDFSTEWNYVYIGTWGNQWFAHGCNIGIQHAKTLGATHIGLVNPDTLFVYDDILSQIVEAFSSLAYGIIGTYILSAWTHKIEFGGADMVPGIFYPKVRKLGDVYSEKNNTVKITPTDYTTGSSLFFSLELYENIGPIDESYFLYFEETDWCFRARSMGYQIGIISSTALDHKTSQSVGFRSSLYTKYMIRNYAKFALRYARWYEIPLWSLLYVWFWIPGQTVSHLYRKIF
jgi:GT2 family glycosyltransferase